MEHLALSHFAKAKMKVPHILLMLLALTLLPASALAQFSASGPWKIDVRGAPGPVVKVDLANYDGKSRAVVMAFEYERQCDPVFSFLEMAGSRIGRPKNRQILTGSSIGLILNGQFYTWHAGLINYDNGFEAAFGIPNDLLLQLLVNVKSLVYVTPRNERITLPTANFSQMVQEGIRLCGMRIK